MTKLAFPEIGKNRCPCGAKRSVTSKRCRKCSARGRYRRRKAWRAHKNPNHYSTGKK